MHKRNLTITALVLAAIVTAAFVFFPRLNHSSILGIFYFPAIFLSVALSGGHSPSAVAGWSSFVAYTLAYGFFFLIIYVILLEIYLLRRVLHHLDDAKTHLVNEEPDSRMALEHIGRAIAAVETRRRKHFLLKPVDSIDLTEAPHLLAARAMTAVKQASPVKKLLKRLHLQLAAETGPIQASEHLANLRNDAEAIVSREKVI